MAEVTTSVDVEQNIIYFNFAIPKGDKGDTGNTGPANSLSIGTVENGDSCSATITGTAPNQTLNLVLEKGDKPVKGVDYYTAEDKQEMVDDVYEDVVDDIIVRCDTVADLKADTSLTAGMTIETLGYSSINDGGGASYVIVDDELTGNDWTTIELDNDLFAVLKSDGNEYNVAKFGILPGSVSASQITKLNTFISDNPYCSLKFGKGTYELADPIVLLQGSTLCGIGNDTKLKPASGKWAIICKGLASLNSSTCIYNLTIDGNFLGNGINIDGTRYSRCEIHDIFVTSCVYGIRNAKPVVADNYDNFYVVGVGGNNLHDIYITGETPNGDTSRCNVGLCLYANDNFITNVRVSGFHEQGVLLNGSGNQFTMLKAAVNHTGFRCVGGGQNFGSICAEESFQNNFELIYVRNSTLELKTSAAGCVVDDSLPSTLNYYDVVMTNCSQNNIKINGFVAQSFTYRKSGELALLNIQDSMLNEIDISYGNSEIPNKYSVPLISNCAFANDITINTQSSDKFVSYNILSSVTVQQPSNTTITGTYPDLTVVNSSNNATQNLVGLDLTNHIDNNLVVFDNCRGTYPPQICQISYKFNGVTSVYNYQLDGNFISSYSQNGAIFAKMNIKSILETQDDYLDNIALGKTLQYVRVFLRCTHAKAGTSYHSLVITEEVIE